MEIRDEIVKTIEREKWLPAPVIDTADLCTDLRLDSLAYVRLLLHIEEIFEITFSLMEMGMCRRVDRLIALVEKKVKEKEHDTIPAAEPGG